MTVNKKIMDTLRPLGVPVRFGTYEGTEDTYIVFIIYNEAPRMNANDKEVITKYFIQIDVFSKNDFIDLVNEVKERMKAAGFSRMFASQTYEPEMKMFREIIRFNYDTEFKEEE